MIEMQKIWSELSKPLPPRDAAEPSVVTSQEERPLEEITAALDKADYEHLAEGRANVVFSIKSKSKSSPGSGDGDASSSFAGTVLRVPKATPGVTPCDYQTLQDFHEKLVDVRVGREHIVPQLLVTISAAVAERLNAERRRGKGKGKEKGKGKGKQQEEDDDGSVIRAGHAMLMQDMSETPGYRALEFKPKWLAQSPLAPADAVRCRTCAREAYRNHQKKQKKQKKKKEEGEQKEGEEKDGEPPVCPLGLLHPRRAVVMATVDRLVAPQQWSERERSRLADALRGGGLLERLRALQTSGDPGRALLEAPWDPDFGLAMTLRDCSLFVRMPVLQRRDGDDDDAVDEGEGEEEEEPVALRLGDVDKKNWEEKQTYWQEGHRNLVDNGWYSAARPGDGDGAGRVETACVLELDRCLEEGKGAEDIPGPFRQRMSQMDN
ncbi:inositol-pentakisphosphate 2-kinase-domain-containing protein [Xylariaceae sp. FL0804]|nr:inositol-pentakisphosphate 2-kinase-domain-containing protein [Xylariaceae sp. FL0804]